MRVFISALLSVTIMGSAAAQNAPLDKVYACASITKADERLACYDAAISGLKQAEATGGVAVVSKEQIADAEKQAFGLTAPSLSSVAKTAAPAAAPDPLDRVEVTIASVTRKPNKLLRFTLSDGQVWEEYDDSFGRLSGFPLRAEIRKGALGGFMMKVGDKPLVRVRRVK
jgi:hypothetical protein